METQIVEPPVVELPTQLEQPQSHTFLQFHRPDTAHSENDRLGFRFGPSNFDGIKNATLSGPCDPSGMHGSDTVRTLEGSEQMTTRKTYPPRNRLQILSHALPPDATKSSFQAHDSSGDGSNNEDSATSNVVLPSIERTSPRAPELSIDVGVQQTRDGFPSPHTYHPSSPTAPHGTVLQPKRRDREGRSPSLGTDHRGRESDAEHSQLSRVGLSSNLVEQEEDEDEISHDDLLYALLYRHEQQKSEEVRSEARRRQFKARYVNLKKENNTFRDQLVAARKQASENAAEKKTAAQELDTYKTKYYKIKSWAHDINHDFAKLRQDLNKMSNAQTELRQGTKAIEADIGITQNNMNAVESKIQQSVQASTEECQSVLKSLKCEADLRRDLANKDHDLQEERRRNQRMETHIANLEVSQRQVSMQLVNLQKQMTNNREKLSNQSHVRHESNAEIEAVIDSAGVTIGEQLSIFIKGIEASFHDLSTENIASHQAVCKQNCSELLNQLTANHDQSLHRSANILSNVDRIILLFFESKTLLQRAKAQAETTQNTVDQQQQTISQANRSIQELQNSENQLQDAIRQASIKAANQQTKLGENSTRVANLEQQIERGRIERENDFQRIESHERSRDEMRKQIADASAKLENTTSEKNKIAESLLISNAELKQTKETAVLVPQLEETIATKSLDIKKLQDQVQCVHALRQENATYRVNAGRLSNEIETMQRELNKSRENGDKLESTTEQFRTANEDRQRLTTRVAGLEQEVRSVESLRSQIKDRDKEASNLQSRLAEKQLVVEELEAGKQNNYRKISNLENTNDTQRQQLADVNAKNEAKAQKIIDLEMKTTLLQKMVDEQSAIIARRQKEQFDTQACLEGLDSQMDELEETVSRPVEKSANPQRMTAATPASSFAPRTVSILRAASGAQRRAVDRSAVQVISTAQSSRTALILPDQSVINGGFHGIDQEPEIPESLILHNDKLSFMEDVSAVPETQLELSHIPDTVQQRFLSPVGPRPQASSSELSEISDISEPDPYCPANLPHGLNDRPPQSSHGSVSDQMLLDAVSLAACTGQDQSQSETSIRQGVVKSKTKANHNLESRSEPKSIVSISKPRFRKTKGSRSNEKSSTPAFSLVSDLLESSDEEQQADMTSPKPTLDRHLPNSAIKRRVEVLDSSQTTKDAGKRLKRNPGNLEVNKPSGGTAASTSVGGLDTASQTKLAHTGKNSVVGKNAPAPGTSIRQSKTVRKGSKKDKYATRFGDSPNTSQG